MAYESRDEIEERYRWDLSSIYADDEAFLAALNEARGYAGQARGVSRRDIAIGQRPGSPTCD